MTAAIIPDPDGVDRQAVDSPRAARARRMADAFRVPRGRHADTPAAARTQVFAAVSAPPVADAVPAVARVVTPKPIETPADRVRYGFLDVEQRACLAEILDAYRLVDDTRQLPVDLVVALEQAARSLCPHPIASRGEFA